MLVKIGSEIVAVLLAIIYAKFGEYTLSNKKVCAAMAIVQFVPIKPFCFNVDVKLIFLTYLLVIALLVVFDLTVIWDVGMVNIRFLSSNF